MSRDSRHRHPGAPGWHALLLATALVLLAGAVVAGWWWAIGAQTQADVDGPGSGAATATLEPAWTATATLLPAPGSTRAPTASPAPTRTPAPTPAVRHPTLSSLLARVEDETRTITFEVVAQVPAGRGVDEAILWYDTEAGQRLQRIAGPFPEGVTLSYRLDAVAEGLTRTLTPTQEMDYWWLVRDTAGEAVRGGGVVRLGPALQALVVPATPELPPIDFAWSVSPTQHYQFLYKPGTAAERDRFAIGAMAEAALSRVSARLEMVAGEQMGVYLVPRIFWQGGATYGNKVQLISYLDRNYTGVETWSYFTHEGTHALAQDLLQPKEDGGGPDGVLVEGLAVWASGGHYRREPIDAWAAVIAASDEYLPLSELRAGPFYGFQHETSYLEAASFVGFLIDRHGLDRFKELYGRATGEVDHDEALVEELYGQGYTGLEATWLEYLEGLSPTPEQAEAWRFKVRSFDLMRRYETELDPDARILPDSPTEWTSATLQIFLRRRDSAVNVVLETALIAAQERAFGDRDPGAAGQILDDVQAALEAGGAPVRASLAARTEIVDLVAAQDRAVRRADRAAYRATLDPNSPLARDAAVESRLQAPFLTYQQEVVRLEVEDDGSGAEGVVLVHGRVVDGAYGEDGRLFEVRFVKRGDRWRMVSRVPVR